MQRLKHLETTLEVYQSASFFYEQQQNFQQALLFKQQYLEAFQNKVVNDREHTLSQLKVQFDADAKDAKAQLLLKENQLHESQLLRHESEKNFLTLLIAFITIIALTIVFLLLRQVKIRRKFATLALTDELTKAPNRRNVLEFAQMHIENCRHSQTPLTLAMIDLDHFKIINDSFGHDVGDQVLISFYQVAVQAIRNVDRIGRLGGEEWLLVMPGANLAHAEMVFQRISEGIGNRGFG